MPSHKRKEDDHKHPKLKNIKKHKKSKSVEEPALLEHNKAMTEPQVSPIEHHNGDSSKHSPEDYYNDGDYADLDNGDAAVSSARITACFHPKFDNEKSDQEVRAKMIEMVSKGKATLEVTLKHSGSLFMYSGPNNGAYAKNSFRNIFTAVGVFVLGRTFHEAWGSKAFKKQAKFNKFIEKKHICVSMELVTAVLGDHGQRPNEDYIVVTAVAELGSGMNATKPKFYSTPEIIAFCRKWRLPTNHVWLFSTKKSVTSFFAAYDALYEEGTATPVCKVLDEIAEMSVPGSKDHVVVQGEILEGLVARIVSRESLKYMEQVLNDFPPPKLRGGRQDMGPSLRELFDVVCSCEKEQIEVLLQSVGTSFCPDYSDWVGRHAQLKETDQSIVSKFIQARPADYSTTKLKEIIQLLKEKHMSARFRCHYDPHNVSSSANDDLHFKLVVHVTKDATFLKYQKLMKRNRGLWPLYRGFFIDVNLSRATNERVTENDQDRDIIVNNVDSGCETKTSTTDDLADEDVNLMIKLKFLTYLIRTFFIRNGLVILLNEGPEEYRAYYLKQMKTWKISAGKQAQLGTMLDEWADYILNCGYDQVPTSYYLSEAEPFLEQYAKRSPANQALVGSAGNLVRDESLLINSEEGWEEEGELDIEGAVTTSNFHKTVTSSNQEGLIVFFPGIPGCAKSVLCKEILSAPGGLGDGRPIHSLMGDLVKGKYWKKVADERTRNPYAVTLADKNAPNEEVWGLIEDMCLTTGATAVPVIADCEGTESNPFSLDALAVFMFRVLQRINHPGKLDKASPVVGYVLLMFYHLYEGKNRNDFESELIVRFGALVKMPLLEAERFPLPSSVKSVLQEGIHLYKLHASKHGKLESTRGSYSKEWDDWEKRLREVLFQNAKYLNAIQVPFDSVVKQVFEKLGAVGKGNYVTPSRKSRTIVFSAVTLPVTEIIRLLNNLAQGNSKVKNFIRGKDMKNCLTEAHLTLAHKRIHGVTAVARYGVYLQQDVPVHLTALLFSNKVAAMEASLGKVDGEKIVSKIKWPHVTIWTKEGVAPKEANTLPQLLLQGKATRIEIEAPITIWGTVDFYQ